MLGVAFANIFDFYPNWACGRCCLTASPWCPTTCRGNLFSGVGLCPQHRSGQFPQNFFCTRPTRWRGVAAASPLYIAFGDWVNPLDLDRPPAAPDVPQPTFELFPTSVKVLAFNPTRPVLNIPAVNQQLDRLTAPGAVLYDRLGQEKLGPIPTLFHQQGGISTLMK